MAHVRLSSGRGDAVLSSVLVAALTAHDPAFAEGQRGREGEGEREKGRKIILRLRWNE
jgi:hypothetical protein